MNRSIPIVLVVSAVLAGCGPEKVKTEPGTTVPAPKQGDAPKAADPAKPAPPPAEWSSKDAKGHDWAAQMGAIKFDTNWQDAMKRAKSSGRPLILLFTEKTSADAAKMAATFKDPRVVAATAEFVVALVDNDENGPLAERYNVKGTPTVVYASPAGEELGATIGVNADEVLGDIKSALSTLKDDEEERK